MYRVRIVFAMNIIKSFVNNFFSISFSDFLRGHNIVRNKGVLIKDGTCISNSKIEIAKGSSLKMGKNCVLRNVSICIGEAGTNIVIGNNNKLCNVNIIVYKANIKIGDNNIFETGENSFRMSIKVLNASIEIGNYNRMRSDLWVRFNGVLRVGNRNAINQRTEIRCDERVEICDYNQISYDCMIWDTNTHNIYTSGKRRKITDKQYPQFGLEYERPKTKPVFIGNDCWIGQGCSILKGTIIKDNCIVAYHTLLSGGVYETCSTIMTDCKIRVINNCEYNK